MREIVNAIFYVLRGGIALGLLPKDFPPWSTVYRKRGDEAHLLARGMTVLGR